MRQNFFEVIGMADVERVHSQMLAWIFKSDALSVSQKSRVLADLVGGTGDYTILDVSTEREHIDVFVVTVASLIAIENKIKIAEHSDQLARYKRSLEQGGRPVVLLFLSLVPEDLSDSSWTARAYRELHAALMPHVFTSPCCFDQHVFNEYAEAVGHLVEVAASFNEDHTKFLNVFTDGSLTKSAKRISITKYTTQQNFVRANQLETALQRYFLGKIRSRFLPASIKSRIEETRGVANLHIPISRNTINGIELEWAVQFQGTAAKLVCCASDYENSSPDQMPPAIQQEFVSLARRHSLRGPHNGRTRAYISLSKSMDFDWADSFESIANSYEKAYAELSAITLSTAAKNWE